MKLKQQRMQELGKWLYINTKTLSKLYSTKYHIFGKLISLTIMSSDRNINSA
jgi:hypothetical protein